MKTLQHSLSERLYLPMARYPVVMNADIGWPAGAKPQLLMRQEHDSQLLEAELQQGKPVRICLASWSDAKHTVSFRHCFGFSCQDQAVEEA